MEEAVKYFLTLHNQVKLYHWTTMSYATHKALDELHEHLGGLIDRFIETYMGHFDMQPVKPPFKVRIDIVSENGKIKPWLRSQRDALTTMSKTEYKDLPGFTNILEEMISLFDNTIYLVNLH
jgi:hypothetical protein